MNMDSWAARGIVVWWPLNHNSLGRVGYDWHRGRYNLTTNNTPTTAPGPCGGLSPVFNGSNQDMEVAEAIIPGGVGEDVPLTFEAWVYPTSVASQQCVVTMENGDTGSCWHILEIGGVTESSVARFQTHDPSSGETFATSTVSCVANQWQHLIGCAVATNSRFVKRNGVATGTNTTSRTDTANDLSRTMIGAFRVSSSYFSPFTGRIAEVIIRNVALTDTECFMRWEPRSRWDLYYQLGLKTYFFSPAGGGTVFTRSVSESLAGSDQFARLSNANRNSIDSLGSQDVFSRVASANRLTSDSLGMTDVYIRQSTANRAYIDSAGLLDAFARIANGLRRPQDSAGLTDQYARVSNANRNFTDTMGLIDDPELAVLGALIIAVAELLGTSDSFSRTSNANRIYTDNAGLSDAFSRVANTVRTYTDTMGLLDAFAKGTGFGRAVSDSTGLSDAYSRTSNANRNPTELLGLADTFSRVASALRSFTDLMGLLDDPNLVLVPSGTLIIAVAEMLGLSDVMRRKSDATRPFSDTMGAVDDPKRIHNAKRAMSDAVALIDTYQRIAVTLRRPVDQLGTGDVFARVASAIRGYTDLLALVDDPTLSSTVVNAAVLAAVFLALTGDRQFLERPGKRGYLSE